MTKHSLSLTESQLIKLEMILEDASLDDDFYSAGERAEIRELLDVIVQFNLLALDDGI